MKTSTKIAVAFVALAGVAGAALTAQADSRWLGREGGPTRATQEAHGGHHGMRHEDGWRGGLRGGGMDRLLESFDTNSDGKLSQEEIDQSREAHLGKFDADGDKSLTLAEYQALWLDAMRERMVDRFQDLDADGDGKVTTAEFERPFAKVVRHMDRNDDGVIDPSDFQRHGPMQGPAGNDG